MAILVLAVIAWQPVSAADHQTETTLLFITPVKQDIHIAVDCYPQALPNDGRSAAEINVVVLNGEKPLANRVVRAEVLTGDGSLAFKEAVTNEAGIAVFPFISGMMSDPTEVSFAVVDHEDVKTSLSIPLAPVAYLDVQLVSPAEYADHLKRQVAAAPIYKLSTDVFPDQLAADGASLATIKARLNNIDGSPAVGVPLQVQIVSGDGTLEVEKVATDSAGLFSFYFISGSTPGTVSVAVIEPSTGLITTTDILLVEAGPARVKLFYVDQFADGLALDGAILPADGTSGLPIVAEITDLTGIPLPGVELNLSVLQDGNGWIDVLDPVSDIAGRVDFTYYAGTGTGLVRLRAYIASGMTLNQ